MEQTERCYSESVLFDSIDNEHSIPSVVDGLIPIQRKVLYTCLKRKDKNEILVSVLAASVCSQCAFGGGLSSVEPVIVKMAQNFIGRNNINILVPEGQFGTRLQGGEDAAKARHLYTNLSPLASTLFPIADEPLLRRLFDDNKAIEPQYYVPVVPLILINGADAATSSCTTKVPSYNIRDVVNSIYRLLDGKDPEEMMPWYRNFRGTISRVDSHRYLVSGEIAVLGDNLVEITELPLNVWTLTYEEDVLKPMLFQTDGSITEYRSFSTPAHIRFVVTMNPVKFREAESVGFHTFFKLQTELNASSMTLFDKDGRLRLYDIPEDILREFFTVRMQLYERRKEYLVSLLEAEILKLENQIRFINDLSEGKIPMLDLSTGDILKRFRDAGYDADPVAVWKKARDGTESDSDSDANEWVENSEKVEGSLECCDYDYLLNMPITRAMLSMEKMLKKRERKTLECENLRTKTPAELWRNELQQLMEKMEVLERDECENQLGDFQMSEECRPSPLGKRVVPKVALTLESK